MSKICCFTGHRSIRRVRPSVLIVRLESTLRELIEKDGYTDFRSGGAVGFDLIAACCVLKLKTEYPHIRLHMLLPCKDQDKNFGRQEKRIYRYVLEHADSIRYVNEHYANYVMFARNRALVDGADLCIACYERTHGGTHYTVNYANKKHVQVVNLSRI